jgi:hypothetical protein
VRRRNTVPATALRLPMCVTWLAPAGDSDARVALQPSIIQLMSRTGCSRATTSLMIAAMTSHPPSAIRLTQYTRGGG